MKLAVIAAITTALVLVAPNAFALNADMTEVDAGEVDLGEDMAGVMAVPDMTAPDMAFSNGDDIPFFVDLSTSTHGPQAKGCSYATAGATPVSLLLFIALACLYRWSRRGVGRPERGVR